MHGAEFVSMLLISGVRAVWGPPPPPPPVPITLYRDMGTGAPQISSSSIPNDRGGGGGL